MSNDAAILSPAEVLAERVTHLYTEKHYGAALLAARQGWRDFPDAELPEGGTFAKLTMILATMVDGGVAAPAEPEGQVQQVAPVSAVPVSAVPVSAPAAAPVSAVPASAPPVAVPPVVIERSLDHGTIIRIVPGMPMLKPIIGHLGWNFAKRLGHLYLGDRDTVPNMPVIAETLAVLAAEGIAASSAVRGDESARPVSAPPARPVSAAPAARKKTQRELAQARKGRAPVSVRQVSSAPAAPQAPVFQAPAVPVSAPAAPAAPAVDRAVAALMAQVQQQQAQMAQVLETLAGMQAPAAVAPVAAPAVPVSAVPASAAPAAPVSAAPAAAPVSAMAQLMASATTEVDDLSWSFKLASGANARKTRQELASRLFQEVGSWWSHHNLGQVAFSVFAEGTHSKVIHVKVKAAAGDVTARNLSAQVVGIALTVKGIIGRSTAKRD